MDIRSKLKLYKEAAEGKQGADSKQGEESRPGTDSKPEGAGQVPGPMASVKAGRDVTDLLPGTVCSNEHGSFYLLETNYALSHSYGGCRLGDALGISSKCLAALGGEEREGACPEGFLFLDTETTGLSGGAGTVAFLIGAGFFQGGSFIVRQYFMRDYDEEAAMLSEFNKLLTGFEGLVTFNGKSFDWNLLQCRFISNRMRPALRQPRHVDLLYPARRIWGLRLESCRLTSLEENILGESREDDIPGMLIPSVYFKYLEDRDASDIKRVIKHNGLDILTMVPLLSRMSTMLESPLANATGEHELLGLGRMLESRGEYALMEECLEACARSGDYAIKAAAVKRLSGIYKRNGEYERAMGHWQRMAEGSGGFDTFPMVEMAMYYEHKAKDLERALEAVELAMQACLRSGPMGGRQFRELEKRRQRLELKAQKLKAQKLKAPKNKV